MNQKLCALAAGIFGVQEASLSSDSTPLNTNGWTSLAHITLVTAVEQEFNVRFGMNEIIAIKSMRDLQALLERHGGAIEP